MADGTRPETITAPPTPHASGVYFALSEREYHADPSLGSGDIKDLLIDPAVYWWGSWMNPRRPADTDTPARLEGRALHKLVLEGPDAFEARFTAEPDPAAYPGCLVGNKDLEAFLKERGVKGTSGKAKADLIRMVKEHGTDVVIWEDILGAFRDRVAREKLEVLKPEVLDRVRQSGGTIHLNPHLAKAFRGGAPEVSVFWVEHGVPLKARFDFLKPKAIVDLKKFANQQGRPVDVAVKMAIATYRYDLQARHYLDGYAHLFTAAQEGRVFGDCPLPSGWKDQIAWPASIRWIWVFHQTDGAPVSIGKQIDGASPALNRAAREIAEAKQCYRTNLATFGTSMWVSQAPITELALEDLPFWMREEPEIL